MAPFLGSPVGMAAPADTVSANQEKAGPSKRELFHEAHRRLGYFKAAVDNLSHVVPGASQERCLSLANTLDAVLNTWERGEH